MNYVSTYSDNLELKWMFGELAPFDLRNFTSQNIFNCNQDKMSLE